MAFRPAGTQALGMSEHAGTDRGPELAHLNPARSLARGDENPPLERAPGEVGGRAWRTVETEADLVVVGGGLAGTCCAITAARAGAKVTLLQDRPVLGGNASSEVRLWILGATAHMGTNSRWAREGGLLDEVLVENTYRNPEGNPVIFDTLLLEKATAEPNLTLRLNTALIEARTARTEHGQITGVTGFCSQNSTAYRITAPLFCDASGDGALGYLAGAGYRMGAERVDEFGEGYAPSAEYGGLLGHSLYFYTKDTGAPVKYVPPAYALDDVEKHIPRHRSFTTREDGCRLWWIEYGGRLDTVHETESIKWELWKVVYGVWNYLKNSGKFPEAENLTLEWAGTIPGKRESRRFEGLHMLTQSDIVEQPRHPDTVAYGGWPIDMHPADGVYSHLPGTDGGAARGVYEIPYRCYVSRDIPNLFLAGRIISVSHVAFGSTRVMGTGAHGGQAVGMAAAICARDGIAPAEMLEPERMAALQRALLRTGQHLPGRPLDDPDDLVRRGRIEASSCEVLAELPADGAPCPLDRPCAQLLPARPGPFPAVTLTVRASAATTLHAELRTSDRPENHGPSETLATRDVPLGVGEHHVRLDFTTDIDTQRYVSVCLADNEDVEVVTSRTRLTGVLALHKRGAQELPPESGFDRFEVWTPGRRPGGANFAVQLDPPLRPYAPEYVADGVFRPTSGTHAWVPAADDPAPSLTVTWDEPQPVGRIELGFDTDFDHPMESALMGHPERVMPLCAKHVELRDDAGRLIAAIHDNHQTRRTVILPEPVSTRRLTVRILSGQTEHQAGLFDLRCYAA